MEFIIYLIFIIVIININNPLKSISFPYVRLYCTHPARTIIRAQTEIGRNITKILNTILDKRYDKRVRPDYAGPPVEVGVTMYIISISSVSEVQMVCYL